jgi:hypothetical protein
MLHDATLEARFCGLCVSNHHCDICSFNGITHVHRNLTEVVVIWAQLVAKRPVSPHVFEIDNKSFHYKMPVNALTSVTNRFTGVALSVGGFTSTPRPPTISCR